MFTGLVEGCGTVRSFTAMDGSWRLVVAVPNTEHLEPVSYTHLTLPTT